MTVNKPDIPEGLTDSILAALSPLTSLHLWWVGSRVMGYHWDASDYDIVAWIDETIPEKPNIVWCGTKGQETPRIRGLSFEGKRVTVHIRQVSFPLENVFHENHLPYLSLLDGVFNPGVPSEVQNHMDTWVAAKLARRESQHGHG